MSIASYFKSRIFDLILVFISAWSMATVGFNAFFIDAGLQHGFLPLAGVLALTIVLFATSYKRSWRVGGTVVFLFLAAAFVVAGIVTSTSASPYVDVEGCNFYFALVIIFSAAACFLLTRTLPGSVVWLIAAAFLCSVVQAFYQSEELVFSALVLASALSLVVYANFKKGTLRADSATRRFGIQGFLGAIVPVALVCLLALGIWFVVIAPLNPGVFKVKLVTDYRQLPIMYVHGTAKIQPQYNTDRSTSKLTDGERYTDDDLLVGTSDDKINAKSKPKEQSEGSSGGGSSAGSTTKVNKDSANKKFKAISYTLRVAFVIIAIIVTLAIIAAIVAFFLVRRKRRVQRLAKMLMQDSAQQVIAIYGFLLPRMERIGFKVPAGVTLDEFFHNQARRMDGITDVTKVSFEELTATYGACVYGNYEPSEEEIVPFVAFYLAFWKAARAHLGNVHYFFKSFRL